MSRKTRRMVRRTAMARPNLTASVDGFEHEDDRKESTHCECIGVEPNSSTAQAFLAIARRANT